MYETRQKKEAIPRQIQIGGRQQMKMRGIMFNPIIFQKEVSHKSVLSLMKSSRWADLKLSSTEEEISATPVLNTKFDPKEFDFAQSFMRNHSEWADTSYMVQYTLHRKNYTLAPHDGKERTYNFKVALYANGKYIEVYGFRNTITHFQRELTEDEVNRMKYK